MLKRGTPIAMSDGWLGKVDRVHNGTVIAYRDGCATNDLTGLRAVPLSGVKVSKGGSSVAWNRVHLRCLDGANVVKLDRASKALARSSTAADGEPISDWQCLGANTMPLDISEDPFDAAGAKAGLLETFSSGGTILDEAKHYFLAFDIKAPLKAASYKFPFCRVSNSGGAGVTASKTGWRESLASLEQSIACVTALSEARALIDVLEARIQVISDAAARSWKAARAHD